MTPVKRGIEATLFVAVLALGWRYPWLGWCIVINVAVGLVLAVLRGGRQGCGNFCPKKALSVQSCAKCLQEQWATPSVSISRSWHGIEQVLS